MDRQFHDALGFGGPILYAEHHESHAASAFYPSPFEEAAVLTMDGVGEWATASIGVGRGRELKVWSELHWPDSLGLLYVDLILDELLDLRIVVMLLVGSLLVFAQGSALAPFIYTIF